MRRFERSRFPIPRRLQFRKWWKRSSWAARRKRRCFDGMSRHRGEGGTMMQKLVVVGNGMAGVACVEQILKHAPKFEITIFGDETHVNYNRILLSAVLAGEKAADEIHLNGLDWYEKHGIALRLGVRVEEIDRERRQIRTTEGDVTEYDHLVIATGSS